MNEEKMMILRMLKEGKISEEEAFKLLDVLEKKEDEKDFEAKLNKNLEEKFNKFGENFGEKVGKIGEDLSDGASSLTDKIMDMVDSFMDKGGFTNILGSHDTKNEILELEVNDIENPVLDIKGINGNINLNPWSKDYVYVKAICYIKKNKISTDENIMDLRKEKNKIILKPLFNSNIGVKLDISVPLQYYNEINLITSNGKINIYDLKAENIISNTTNGSITLNSITSKNTIDLNTKNGRITLKDIKNNDLNIITKNTSINLDNVTCEKGTLISQNGKINLNNSTIDTIDINTSNSPIKVENSNIAYLFGKTSNGKVDIKNLDITTLKETKINTSNSGIYIYLKDFYKDYNISASTTNSKINLNLPQLVYDYNDKNKSIKAHKEGSSNNPVVFDLHTTNRNIEFNKKD
ncbi:DUF4097 family beta strand repeat protein [Clostridium sp. D2Q-14]|uniref:DUF4097 family beta strand repeat-containing protein n=1 Tax=Anaeromonas gelatinilytica TaxID=2683194 RepID=UPI00193BA365|nr:DUF4097 family beta strand repeat-containing protein [Anaeromonas gelatinilytica]MBS4534403.1 DUF4097 family beta strand repeat protein [Anaeromonas gelatinilytica]